MFAFYSLDPYIQAHVRKSLRKCKKNVLSLQKVDRIFENLHALALSLCLLFWAGIPTVIVGLVAAIKPSTFDMAKAQYKDITCGSLKLTAEVQRNRYDLSCFLIIPVVGFLKQYKSPSRVLMICDCTGLSCLTTDLLIRSPLHLRDPNEFNLTQNRFSKLFTKSNHLRR